MLDYLNPDIPEWERFLTALDEDNIYQPKGFDRAAASAQLKQLIESLKRYFQCTISERGECSVQDSALLGIIVFPPQFDSETKRQVGIAVSKFGNLVDLNEEILDPRFHSDLRRIVEKNGYVPVPPQILDRSSSKHGWSWRTRYLSWF